MTIESDGRDTGRAQPDSGAGRGMARVSIGIPTWNRAELLREAIQSVLRQTMTDLELFVFDNASTDHTADVVASFDDPRLHYVRNETNLGNQPNMTSALRAGTAPYVHILLDDEYMLPTCLERKASVLDAHPEVVAVHSSFREIDLDGNVLDANANFAGLAEDTVETGRAFIERSLLKPGGRIHLGSFLARRGAVEDEGFFAEDLPLDDNPLWLRLATKGGIAFLAQPLDVRRIVPGVSSDAGYLVYRDGRYVPTLWLVKEAKALQIRFIERYAASHGDARRLRRLARRGARRFAAQVLRRSVPGWRPPRKAAGELLEAVKIEPSVLLEPRLLRVAFPGSRRSRSNHHSLWQE